MHKSFFSYKLERRYPFKWFTWVIIIGGVALTAIFSTITVAVNGYETSIIYTTDLNSTTAQKYWFDNPLFSWTNKPSTKCEPADIRVGQSTIYTNNLFAAYTIKAVSVENNNNTTPAPSLTYGNEILQNCSMRGVYLSLEGLMDRDAVSVARTRWNARLASDLIECVVVRDDTVSTITLSTSLDPTVPFSLTAVDKMPNSPLWWSWAMLLWYLIESLSTFNSMTDASDDDILKGSATFFVNSSEPDVKSEYFLLVHEGYFYLNDLSTRDNIMFDPDQSVPNWAQHPEKYGNISFAINNYVKSFYTLIMTDLGSSNPTLVSDTEALRSYTESFRHGPSYGMFRPLTTQSFVDSSGNGQPEDFMMKPATLYAQYICQLPKLKSTGSLVAAVVLADLVFLSAAWNLLNWGASGWLRRGDRMAMFCEGCAQSRQTKAPCAGSDPEDGNTYVVDVEERSAQKLSRDGQFGESTYELLEREVQ
ncbi:hypothetical protein SUNI508_06003 [Seiridium unicorne]|uniref:Transmembrane protein n=1 Tax=Seiridium unicorne TaxID=138068 RepID=A0ABR2V3V1_9PEZI